MDTTKGKPSKVGNENQKKRSRHPSGYWTKEQVITNIHLRKEQGKSLTVGEVKQDDYNLYHNGSNLFGRWYDALGAAGYKPENYHMRRPRGYWTVETVQAELVRRDAEGLGIYPADIYRDNKPLVGGLGRVFGTWENAMESLGGRYAALERPKTRIAGAKNRVKTKLQQRIDNNQSIVINDIIKEDHNLYNSMLRLYGTMDAAYESIGKDANDYFTDKRNRYWTAETVYAGIQERKDAGLSLLSQDVNKDNSSLVHYAHKYCGGWGVAVRAVVGDDVRTHGKRRPNGYWTRETVLKELQERKDAGLSMRVIDIQKDNGALARQLYRHLEDYKKEVQALTN